MSSAFHFKLEAVLTYRKREEEQYLGLYQQAKRKDQQLRQSLNEKQEELTRSLHADYQLNAEHVNTLQWLAQYQQSLRHEVFAFQQQIRFHQRTLSQAYDTWLQARQKVQIIEKLKDQHYQDFQQQLFMEELKLLDEYAVSQKRKE